MPELKRSDSNAIADILVHRLNWERGKAAKFQDWGTQKAYYPPVMPPTGLEDDESCDYL